jgi:hypothetical protein
MKKMSRKSFVDLFPPFEPDNVDSNVASTATSKSHKHIHKPAAKSKTGKITPAEYRRRHKGVSHG